MASIASLVDRLPAMPYLYVLFDKDGDEVLFPPNLVFEGDGKRFMVGPYVGGGGNSSVYEGREIDANGESIRTCAVKMQRKLTEGRRARFENEVRIHSRIDHIRVASFYGSGHWQPRFKAYD